MGIVAGYLMPHPPIMVEEVGGHETKRISSTIEAAREVGREIRELSPDTVVVISPHGPIFQDALCIYDFPLQGDLAAFGAAGVRQEYVPDEDLRRDILELAEQEDLPVVLTSRVPMKRYGLREILDHGVTVPMHFINQYASNFKLLPLSFGLLPYEQLYRFGMLLRDAVDTLDKRVVVIASGDLSHHLTPEAPAGFDPRGKVFDETLMSILEEYDLRKLYTMDQDLIDAAGECGLRSLWILAGALDKAVVKAQVLSYEGPFGVGYGIARFCPVGKGKGQWEDLLEAGRTQREHHRLKEDPYVRLARFALESYVRDGQIPALPEDIPEEMLQGRAGVFVSINKHGHLRGCIGTFLPTRENIGKEIIHNAISAGGEDPRFDPVVPEELEDLIYSVDVLTSPEPVDSEDQLDPKRYGVIVKKGFRTGLLLPDLDGVDTVEEQIEIALKKAGIWPAKGYSVERFEVVRHR